MLDTKDYPNLQQAFSRLAQAAYDGSWLVKKLGDLEPLERAQRLQGIEATLARLNSYNGYDAASRNLVRAAS